jgi:hypothetical protein
MAGLSPKEWSTQANKLQVDAGRPLDRQTLEQKLGKPEGKVTRGTSLEKGGTWKPRTGNRRGQGMRRSATIKLRGAQSKDERLQNRRLADKVRRKNKKIQDPSNRGGTGFHIDHINSLKLLYQTVEHLQSEAEKILHIEKLEKAYGPLGDRPANRQELSAADNLQKNIDANKVQDRLKQMELKRPSESAAAKLLRRMTPNQTVGTDVDMPDEGMFDVYGDFRGVQRIQTGPDSLDMGII